MSDSNRERKLEQLIVDCIPDMEARVNGLRELWPSAEVLLHLHRNERLLQQMKNVQEERKVS